MNDTQAAKTVSFSPMRSSNVIFKNTLDSPSQLKWPEIGAENAAVISDKLKRSLAGMKPPVRKKEPRGKKKQQKEVLQPSIPNKEDVSTQPTVEEPPLPKKLCKASLTGATSEEGTIEEGGYNQEKGVTIEGESFNQEKRSQVVVGMNAVSRHLERGNLRAGLVCSSATLMHQHLLMLAATRGVPFTSLSALPETITPLLGLKRAMSIGFRKLGSDEHDHFTELVATISRLAPPLHIPWLSINSMRVEENTTSATGDEIGSKTGTDNEAGPGGRWFEFSTSDISPEVGREVTKLSPKAKEGRSGKSPAISGRGRTQPKGRKRKREGRTKLSALATPEVRYFPLNIKKTIIRPKSRKKKKLN